MKESRDRQPPEVVIRHAELPSPLRQEIEEHVDRLCARHRSILRCRATIEGPGRHHRQGWFQLRLRMTLPGIQIEISRQTGDNPRVAIREAFAAGRRRVVERTQRLQRKVKTHHPGNGNRRNENGGGP